MRRKGLRSVTLSDLAAAAEVAPVAPPAHLGGLTGGYPPAWCWVVVLVMIVAVGLLGR